VEALQKSIGEVNTDIVGMAVVMITITGMILLVFRRVILSVVLMPTLGMQHRFDDGLVFGTIALIGFHRCKYCLQRKEDHKENETEFFHDTKSITPWFGSILVVLAGLSFWLL